jgi:hypothetical protein
MRLILLVCLSWPGWGAIEKESHAYMEELVGRRYFVGVRRGTRRLRKQLVVEQHRDLERQPDEQRQRDYQRHHERGRGRRGLG